MPLVGAGAITPHAQHAGPTASPASARLNGPPRPANAAEYAVGVWKMDRLRFGCLGPQGAPKEPPGPLKAAHQPPSAGEGAN